MSPRCGFGDLAAWTWGLRPTLLTGAALRLRKAMHAGDLLVADRWQDRWQERWQDRWQEGRLKPDLKIPLRRADEKTRNGRAFFHRRDGLEASKADESA